MTAAVAMAFGMGLLGSLGHCLGMCGPLVASFALAAGPLGTRRAFAGQLVYHAGRITTYALVGATMGATGRFLDVAGGLAGIASAVAIVAGGLMIVLGLGTAGVSRGLAALEAHASARFVALVRTLLAGGGAGRLYPLGLAFGFLPCGLSLQAFLAAAGTGGVAPGFAVAFAFGLGTLPALLVAGGAGAILGVDVSRGGAAPALGHRSIPPAVRVALSRAAGVLVVAMGVLFVARGLGFHAGL